MATAIAREIPAAMAMTAKNRSSARSPALSLTASRKATRRDRRTVYQKPVAAPAAPFMRALRRRHANEHLRAEDKETGGEETGRLHHVAGERHQPQRTHREQNPAAKIKFIGPRLPLKSLSEPQPATSADKSPQLKISILP